MYAMDKAMIFELVLSGFPGKLQGYLFYNGPDPMKSKKE